MTNEEAATLRARVLPSRVALAIMFAVCVVVPIVLVTLQIDLNPRFSATDETAHFDYVDRVAQGSIPRQGEEILPSTRREAACRNPQTDEARARLCHAREIPPQDRRPGKVELQYEAQQPPTYYAVTVPLRWVAEHVFQVDDKLAATRAGGLFWLVAGLLCLWVAGRLMSIGVAPLAAVLLLLAAAPLTIEHAGTVSNDATAVFAGGFIALIGALAHRRGDRGLPAVVLVLAGALVVSLKVTNVFPVAAVAALFAVAAIGNRADGERGSETFKRWWRVGGWLLLGSAVVGIAWVLVHRSLALIPLAEDPSFNILRLEKDYSTWNVLAQATGLFEPLTGLFTSRATLGQNVELAFYPFLGYLLLAGALAGMFTSPRRWNHWLGLVTIPVVYVLGVILGLGVALSYDANPGLSGRYALSIAPLLILVLGASLVGRWAVRALGAFAVAMALTIFAVMVT